jgi:hypothetical protein
MSAGTKGLIFSLFFSLLTGIRDFACWDRAAAHR